MNLPQPSNVPEFFPGELPSYSIGQVVRHRRYGYRGVVVDFDMSCRADADWYETNLTQPSRAQPWYHVLVHDSASNTYVAQENLAADPAAQAVHNPLIGEFFDAFDDPLYVRNDHRWPTL